MCSSFFLKAVLLFVVLIQLNVAGYGSNLPTDQVALLKIKSMITNDPLGVFGSWNDSLPCCTWPGVTCGRRHKRVTSLDLTGKGLAGSLSPFLGNLSFLRSIILDENQFYGIIPLEISHLYRLEILSLENNSFTGEIPGNLSSCSQLQQLYLYSNKLFGKIPDIFSSLQMLTTLDLMFNNFTGGIPPSIGNLTYLETLYLGGNPLGGGIPDSFNRLKELRKLSLGKNDLIGVFPLFSYNLSMLEFLNIPENQLHGKLPIDLCFGHPHLKLLAIGANQFSGLLPTSISNCSKLKRFDASENHFKGEIKIDFGKLEKLEYLGLAANNFESDCKNLFDSLSNCSNLMTLELSVNRLIGVLPNSLGNFSSKLKYIGLFRNYVSGSLPSSIGNLFGLTFINLDLNNFTGMIPESIGKLRNMEGLYLDFNAFSGIIPLSIGNLSFLTELDLSANKLQGTIPSTLRNCEKLLYLDLYGNNLSGSIPKEVFQLTSLAISLDLSQNNLSGVIPQAIGNLKNLGNLDLSENRLSGKLPRSFSSCISLQTLNLSRNFFHGSMLEALRSLRGLEYVNMSRNNFSGHIPSYLQDMDLKYLDLSYNNFEGEVSIKGVFAKTSMISIIGNARLCGGIPELHLPKCTSSDFKRSTGGLSVRVVVAISLSSTIVGFVLVLFLLFYCCKRKNTNKQLSDTISTKSFEKISYGRLYKATNGFSVENLIGTGSFASVYKGVLDGSGLTVAIKVLNLNHRGGVKSFMAECDALRNIRHRNLVKVLTSCSSTDFQGNDFKALVYDFMPNGSLERWLHSIHQMLDLVQRINIIRDVACALEYLHCYCGNVIVHCDLKPSNILLDSDMVAHVGDFGIAKVLSIGVSNANNISSSVFKGTIGYAPPEYGFGSAVSTNGDIYSYGILLLEMITGKKPVDPMFKDGRTLHSYARNALADGSVLQILDPVLLEMDVDEKSLNLLVKIGVQCSSESPQDRIDIETVLHELLSIIS